MEVWTTNPWGDQSANWTDYTKSQVPYYNRNDGLAFVSAEDYFSNFHLTMWAEIRDDYDVNFIDFALNSQDSLTHHFDADFTYYGDPGNNVYIFNDQKDSRLLPGCQAPITVSSLTVTYQNGTVYSGNGFNVKIMNASAGVYHVAFYAQKLQSYARYVTITSYSQEGKVNFIPPAQNSFVDYLTKQCPNACNLQGACNSFSGVCTCYFGVNNINNYN